MRDQASIWTDPSINPSVRPDTPGTPLIDPRFESMVDQGLDTIVTQPGETRYMNGSISASTSTEPIQTNPIEPLRRYDEKQNPSSAYSAFRH
jgi:hypothetical protein